MRNKKKALRQHEIDKTAPTTHSKNKKKETLVEICNSKQQKTNNN